MNKINKIKQLTAELLDYCHYYYNLGAPKVSDYIYDKKYDELEALEKEVGFALPNSPTQKVQGDIQPYLKKVTHTIPMLSANKSKNILDVVKFIDDKDVCVSYKLDGITVVLQYRGGILYKAASRGNGIEGEDITHTVKLMENVPLKIPYKENLEIRGEAVLSWKIYEDIKANESIGHPRNIVSGALRKLDPSEVKDKHIHFFAFTLVNWEEIKLEHNRKSASLDFLEKLGFDVVPHFNQSAEIPNTNLFIEVLYKRLNRNLNREDYDFPTDGWVFEYQNLAYGESLGSTAHHDRKMFALKPEANESETIFIGIEYNVCRNGTISMTAIFEPVEVGNTMIQKAYLHNISFFKNLELGKGDVINVIKANEIIPYITENQTRSNTCNLIKFCPCCGQKLIIENDLLVCPNKNCSDQMIQKLAYFVSKKGLDIKGLSEGIIATLFDKGFLTDYNSLFHLYEHEKELLKISGFNTKKTKKILESIEFSKTTTLAKFISGLGIPSIGPEVAKVIEDECLTFENFSINFEHNFVWSDIEGIGEITNAILYQYWNEYKDLIIKTAKNFNFVQSGASNSNTAKETVFFTNKKVCITGTLNSHTRNEMRDLFDNYGIQMIGTVSKNCDYLICNDIESKSAKVLKALELGVPIITEQRFFLMIRNNKYDPNPKYKLNFLG